MIRWPSASGLGGESELGLLLSIADVLPVITLDFLSKVRVPILGIY